MDNPTVSVLLKIAEESAREYREYEEEMEKDDSVLNDWERTEGAHFADGYRAGIVRALRALGLVTVPESEF